MANPTDIQVASLTASLDRSDKSVLWSVGILVIGMIAATSPSSPDGVVLPGGLSISSPKAALFVVLAAHFFNGIRYCFYLNRAVSIASALPNDIRVAVSSHPSPATSNIMTESVQTLLLSTLTYPIVRELFAVPTVFHVLIGLALSAPFIVGPVKMLRHLNYKQPGA